MHACMYVKKIYTWKKRTQFIVMFTSEITSCRKRKGGFLRSTSVRRGLRTIQVSVCKSFCVTSQYAISLPWQWQFPQITLVAKFHQKSFSLCCYYDFHSMGLDGSWSPCCYISLPSLPTCVVWAMTTRLREMWSSCCGRSAKILLSFS